MSNSTIYEAPTYVSSTASSSLSCKDQIYLLTKNKLAWPHVHYHSFCSHYVLEYCEYFSDNFLSKKSLSPKLRYASISTIVQVRYIRQIAIFVVAPVRSVYKNVAAASIQCWTQLATDVRSSSPAPDIISSDTLHPIPHPRRMESLNAVANLTWEFPNYFGENCMRRFIMTNSRKARWFMHEARMGYMINT